MNYKNYRITKPDFQFISKKLETLFEDPPGIYYLPSGEGCPARGMLLHEFYRERTDLAKRNVIARKEKVRRVAIDSALMATGDIVLIFIFYQLFMHTLSHCICCSMSV